MLTLFFSGCAKKRPIQNNSQEIKAYTQQLPSISFSERAYHSKKIVNTSHSFSKEIAFKEVYIYQPKNDNDSYTFVWILDPEYTNFEELSKWKLGMILKPKNRADFQDAALEKKGIKTMGVVTKPYVLDDEICIVLRDFKFKPKALQYLKFYLYNDLKKTNLTYWITEDVSFQM